MAEPHKRKRHPKYKTKYQVKNWSEYETSLRNRGDITIWISKTAITTWMSLSNRKRGAQKRYSDLAIETALSLRLLFHLPLRQTEGFLRSILKLMNLNLPCPDHSTLSRRNQSLNISKQLDNIQDPVTFIVDSTGLKVCGQGEWHEKKHGKKQHKKWKKLHIGVNSKGWIMASTITDGQEQDPVQIPDLLSQYKGEIKNFIGDGIYDQSSVYSSVQSHSSNANIIIPPRKNSVPSLDSKKLINQRNKHIKFIQKEDYFKWKRISGYYKQSHVENVFARYKKIFGGRLHSKRTDSQEIEIKIATKILNKMLTLGSSNSYPVI